MSQKANPTVIGVFIVIALALGVGALLIFSSSKLFTQTQQCILYFSTSLNGLNEGAPVKYRGVAIGTVARVMIQFNQATNDYAMPVIIEIQENLLKKRMGDADLFERGDPFKRDLAVLRRLRGSLQTESFVTGVLYVELDTNPNPPEAVYHQLKPLYPEIATQRSEVQELMKNLAGLDVKGLEEKLGALIERVDLTISSLKAGELSQSLSGVLTSLRRVVDSPELTNALAAVPATLNQYRLLAEKIDRRLDPLADSATNTLAQASETLAELRGGAENLRALLAPDSELRHDVTLALEQLANAAQAVSALTEFLKQHPNALITGREILGTKP